LSAIGDTVARGRGSFFAMHDTVVEYANDGR
jgi:hypothetical protein